MERDPGESCCGALRCATPVEIAPWSWPCAWPGFGDGAGRCVLCAARLRREKILGMVALLMPLCASQVPKSQNRVVVAGHWRVANRIVVGFT